MADCHCMALPLRFRDMLCECLVCCYTTQRYTLSFFVACVIAAAHLSSNEPSLSLSRVCLKRGLGAQALKTCSTATYQYACNYNSACLRVVCLVSVASGHARSFFGLLAVVARSETRAADGSVSESAY